jgi:hypothetical protein
MTLSGVTPCIIQLVLPTASFVELETVIEILNELRIIIFGSYKGNPLNELGKN